MRNPTFITLGVAAVAGAVLWTTHEPPTVQPIAHAPALVTSRSAPDPDSEDQREEARPTSRSAGEVSAAPNDESSSQPEGHGPVGEAAQRTLRRGIAAGALPQNLRLPSREDWERLVQLWDDASAPVLAAEEMRRRLGKALARERYRSGLHEEVLFEESQRVNGGFPIDALTKLKHADEWISLRMLYREGGGQRFHIVRVMPGEAPQLDDATSELRLAENLRKDAMQQFLTVAGRAKETR